PNASNPIAGATSTTFTTPVLSVGGQYLYWVQVTNLGGAANSLNATVQVNEATTTVATPPATITYSMTAQTINWQATVSRSVAQTFGIANGDVTFAVTGVGSAGNSSISVISPGVDNVTGSFTVPGHTHANVYPILVSYAGNIPLYLGSSSDNSAKLTILKADQTISGFGPIPSQSYGTQLTIGQGVSATSGQEAGGVIFRSDNPSVATVTGTIVTCVGVGTAHIIASQGGNGDWNPAPDVSQTLVVTRATPILTWSNPADIYYGTA